jgi:hypothetical protein
MINETGKREDGRPLSEIPSASEGSIPSNDRPGQNRVAQELIDADMDPSLSSGFQKKAER